MDRVVVLPLAEICVDAQRLQFRSGVGRSSGTCGRLKGVQTWRPELSGIITVWRDPGNGLTFVVNGHHRVALAQKLKVAALACRYIDATDADEARATGALVNLAEGSGKALDFARALRDRYTIADLIRFGISLSGDVAEKVAPLVALDSHVFEQLVRGRLPESAAVLIGGVCDHAQQRELFRLRQQLSWSDAVLAEACEVVAEAERAEAAGGRQLLLDGFRQEDTTDLSIRLAVRAAVRGRLKSQLRTLQAAGRTGAGWLTAAGCVISADGVAEHKAAAEKLLAGFGARANQPGALRDLLGELAVECRRTGATPQRLARSNWDLITTLILAP